MEWIEKFILISVPFRGSRSEITRVFDLQEVFRPFPSPFGVHVLKCLSNGFLEEVIKKFPSPFGVHVLKFAPASWVASRLPYFRPLSGFTF